VEAIVRADGRQLRLAEGQQFEMSRVAGDPGDVVSFDVLMLLDGEDVTIGSPVVAGAAVKARIAEHGRGRKLTFIKYKSKVRYRRKLGHSQPLTRLVVEEISKG
jgi:large subunit ribosomal protein L21